MKGFDEVSTLEEIDAFIATHTFAFVYVYQENCSVCHSLQPQTQKVLEEFPRIKSVQANVSTLPALAGKFTIFTVPVLLLFVDGKEVLRFARFVEMDKFKHQLSRIVDAY